MLFMLVEAMSDADARPGWGSIDVRRAPSARTLPTGDLGFGRHFSDHMFVAEWTNGGGWTNPRVVPYAPLSLDPAAAVLHYGQALFDGFKAFRGTDGVIRVFRIERHAARLAEGGARMCMPALSPERIIEAVRALVATDTSWVPTAPSSLYLRPTLIATEPFLGVRPAERYTFFLIATPVGNYYAEGVAPVKIWVEREEVRAARGGLGAVKAGANYAAGLHAAAVAKKRGYAQVLWLDAKEHRFLEEVGTMNVFVHLGDEVVTPPLEGSILAGVTRDAVLQLLRDWGLRGVERPITIDEIAAAHAKGALHEMFGCGTAAVISPIGDLHLGQADDRSLRIHDGATGPLAKRLYDEITGIQNATRPDPHRWMTPVA
jgi:branched-chain amino acid aminotransferase